jgi:hypothetical protein
MKIAVCGVNKAELLKKVERHYNVESINTMSTIYDLTKATYEYDNVVEPVVFNGCSLDYVLDEGEMHPFDEQIILCALANLDVVYINTTGMTPEAVSKYHQFDEFYPVRIIDVNSVDTFVIE